MNKKKKQKVFMGVLLSAFLIPTLLWPLLSARAQLPVTDLSASAQQTAFHTGEKIDTVKQRTKTKIADQLKKTLVLTVTMSLRNIALYLARTLAEQTMHTMATGEWDSGPMFETEKWGDMLKNEGDYIAGQFIESFSEDIFAVTGFDICAPKMDYKVWLTASLEQVYSAPRQKPYCTISRVTENWDSFINEWEGKFESLGACEGGAADCAGAVSLGLLDNFGMGYYPTKTDFGLFLTMNDRILSQQQKDAAASTKDREEAQGFKHTTNRFGTKLAAPAEVTKGMAERDIVKAEADAGEKSYSTAQQTITEIPMQMLSTFINTLMSGNMVDSIRKAIMRAMSSSSEAYNPRQKVYEHEKAKQAAVLALKATNMSFPLKEINLLAEYVVCPSERADGIIVPNLNNCVVDQGMFTAAMAADSERAYTVQEAIQEDLLHESWALIGPDEKQNGSRSCYSQAYCYSNLVKLRKARVISVGWEMAAQKVAEMQKAGETGYVSLGEVVRGFYDDSPDNPWYHLIDPNWVLKAPLQRCRVKGYNNMLMAANSDSRQEVCVDVQDCIETDANGNCLGAWGYCRADKNVWRFNGQTCDAQYDSCRVLERRDGKTFNYLTNTLAKDSDICNENTVGCKWYSLWKQDGEWTNQPEDPKLLANKFLADKECKPKEEGCARLITTIPNLGINLLADANFGHFEGALDDDQEDLFSNWLEHPNHLSAILEAVSDPIFVGDTAIKVTTALGDWHGLSSKAIKIAPQPFHRFFIFSAYLYVPSSKQLFPDARLTIAAGEDGEQYELLADASDQDWSGLPQNQWARKYAVVKIEPNVSELRAQVLTLQNGTFYVDATMLEEIDPLLSDQNPSAFEEYAGQNFEYLKKAPDYYNCYDLKNISQIGTPDTKENIDFTNDADECLDKFARMCSADQVGCEVYTKTATSAKVFGIPSYYDYCPSACNGYDAYDKSSTDFELSEFPVYMIADNASSCSGTEVGCDEFTNLDILAQGGEGKEYYSELRHCHEPEPTLSQDPDCANFYTWTGSDQSGYQLLAYKLQDEDQDGEPDVTKQSVACNKATYQAYLSAGVVSDCREFFNENGEPSYYFYTDTITCSYDCHPYRRTIDSKVYMAIPNEGKACSKNNAGCREYKGTQAGNVQAVFNSTFEQGEDVSESVSIKTLGSLCENKHILATAKQAYPYFALVQELNWTGSTCEEVDTGKQAMLQKLSIKDICKFSGNYWDDENAQCYTSMPGVGYKVWTNGIVSSVSVVPGGHSLLLDKTTTVSSTDLTGTILPDQKYRLSFWAKKDKDEQKALKTLTFLLMDKDANTALVSAGVNLSAGQEWQHYNIGNISFTGEPENITLQVSKASGDSLWLDDIKMHTIDDVQYLLKPSVIGSVPDICNENLEGVSFPQVMLGCAEYRDRVGTLHYLKSFSNLCSVDAVGCKAYIDTYNSISPFEQKFSQGKGKEINGSQVCNKDVLTFVEFVKSKGIDSLTGWNVVWDGGVCHVAEKDGLGSFNYNLDQICVGNDLIYDSETDKCYEVAKMIVPADQLIYLIDEKKVQCGSASAGCTAVGAPELDSDKQVKQWDTVFYKLLPDDYKEILCKYESVGCDEFVNTDNQKLYFFDPDETVCEYRKVAYEDVNGDKKTETGWFKKYADLEVCKQDGDISDCYCDAESFYEDGTQNLIRFGAKDFAGWAGECEKSADKCVAFVDPSDKSLSDKGAPYYYIDDKLETCSRVNQFDGCLLFNDTSNFNLIYSSEATYKKADQKKGQDVAPVSVEKENDANKIFKVKRDRECAEWYTCAQGHWTFKGEQYTKECDLLGVCKQIDKTSKECSDLNVYFPDNDYDSDLAGLFDLQKYSNRAVSFSDIDYSGYMIPNMYPLHTLKSVDLATSEKKESYGLAFVGPTCEKNLDCQKYDKDFVCSGDSRCVKDIAGVKMAPGLVSYSTKYTQECRAYPEEESPFPEYVTGEPDKDTGVKKATQFDLANTYTCKVDSLEGDLPALCSKKADPACAKGYVKVSYGGGMQNFYVPSGEQGNLPQKVCQNLDAFSKIVECECKEQKDGDSDTTSVCEAKGEGVQQTCGSCLQKDLDMDVYMGWVGYCLEKDQSTVVYGDEEKHPCVNWYPIDTPDGVMDIYNYVAGAGYVPTAYLGGEFYCVEPALFQYPMSWAEDKCIEIDVESYCREQKYFKMFKDIKKSSLFDPNFEQEMWKFFGKEDKENKDGEIINYFKHDQCTGKDPKNERIKCAKQYFENKKNNKNDKESCPDGYFPVFGPVGSPGFEYNQSLHFNCDNDECGFLCVPYGSRLLVSQARVDALGDSDAWDGYEDLKKYNYNGKECFPGLYLQGNTVKGITQAPSKDVDFFSILYVPYKYCVGPGYLVEDDDTNYDDKYFDYKDVKSYLDKSIYADGDGTHLKWQFDYGIGCYEVAQVAKQDDNDMGPIPKTKAWTNRLWQESEYQLNNGDGTFGFGLSTLNSPFASIEMTESQLTTALAGQVIGDKESENRLWHKKLWDLFELTYCVFGNHLTLPPYYAANGGVAPDACPIFYGNAQGKSYAPISASALKPLYCDDDAQCYVGEEAECEKEDIVATWDSDKPEDWKALWLWRDGCFGSACDYGGSNWPGLDIEYGGANSNNHVSYVGYDTETEQFSFWKKTSWNAQNDDVEEAVPFNGACEEYYVCTFMDGPFNEYQLYCQAPDQWKNINGFETLYLNDKEDPRIGCFADKTPQDQNNGCEEGSNIILCADANEAILEAVENVKAPSPELIGPKNDNDKQYLSTQIIQHWGDEDTVTFFASYKKVVAKDGAFGKCLGGVGLVCLGDKNCQVLECKDHQCIYKGTYMTEEIGSCPFSCAPGLPCPDCKIIDGKIWNCPCKKAPDSTVKKPINTITSNSTYTAEISNKNSFKDRLSKLFRKVYSTYKYKVEKAQPGKTKWLSKFQEFIIIDVFGADSEVVVEFEDAYPNVKISYDELKGVDLAGILAGTEPPIVAGVKADKSPVLNTLGVNTSKGGTQVGGVVKGRNGMLLAELRFYAWADKNHMPISEVKVYFGNGLGYTPIQGRIQNRKQICAQKECSGYEGLTCSSGADCPGNAACVDVKSFGNSDGACVSAFFTYYGIYMCEPKNGLNLPVCAGKGAPDAESGVELADYAKAGCWDADYVDEVSGEKTGACVFVPRVQIMDNWGWCNGYKAYANPSLGGGYYADNCDITDPINEEAATYFNGKVVVVP